LESDEVSYLVSTFFFDEYTSTYLTLRPQDGNISIFIPMIQKKEFWWKNFEIYDFSAMENKIWLCEGYDYLMNEFYICDMEEELEDGFICNCPLYQEIYVKINRTALGKLKKHDEGDDV
jgi:hypothetical protein